MCWHLPAIAPTASGANNRKSGIILTPPVFQKDADLNYMFVGEDGFARSSPCENAPTLPSTRYTLQSCAYWSPMASRRISPPAAGSTTTPISPSALDRME
jgi:hypothetical protein